MAHFVPAAEYCVSAVLFRFVLPVFPLQLLFQIMIGGRLGGGMGLELEKESVSFGGLDGPILGNYIYEIAI